MAHVALKRLTRALRVPLAAFLPFAVLLAVVTLLHAGTALAGTAVRYDDTDIHIGYAGTWSSYAKSTAWNGAYDRASLDGSAVYVAFSGTRLDWIAMKGTTTGKADVYLDGVFRRTVDLSSAVAVYQQDVWSTGTLPAGTHLVKIVRNASSAAGTYITIDAVDVIGTLVYPAPEVAGLSPGMSWTEGGQTVVVSGAGFNGATAVTFGGVAAKSFTVDSSTRITAVAPAHAAGTVQVRVSGPRGASADTAADDFVYEVATQPTITGISPAVGTSSGANVVAITGTGFMGVKAITFDGVKALSFTVESSTKIYAATPAHVAGKVRVQITTAGGTNADTAADDFTYLNRYDDTDGRITYAGTWEAYATRAAWGETYRRSCTGTSSASMYFTGERFELIATKGPTGALVDVYLDGVLLTKVNLYNATFLHQQRVWSTGAIGGGLHKVTLVRDASNASTRYITLDAVEVLGSLGRTGRIEQSDTRLAFSGAWSTISRTGASGGSYKQAAAGGAEVTVRFHGTYLDWVATKGPAMGTAWVSLDGGPAVSVDLYSASAWYERKVWDTGPLAYGAHVVRVWYDEANPSGAFITADAFDIEGTLDQAYAPKRIEQTDTRLIYSGTWYTTSVGAASAGTFKRTTSAAASLVVTFSGTQLDWIATIGPGMGKVDVSVDGGPPQTVDLSAAATVYQRKVWSTGALASTTHLVEFCLSESTPAGTALSVDAFDLQGTLPSSSALTSSEIKWAEQRLADLSYRPGSIDGEYDTQTRSAVVAFQKWEGLSRTGAIDAATWKRLQYARRPAPTRAGTTTPWIEVDKTKQVLLLCKNGYVIWTIPVSTGNASIGVVTPSGTFAIWCKDTALGPCYWGLGVTYYQESSIAIHGYPNVPTYPASHGCVRTQIWDQDALWPAVFIGTKVYIY